MSHFPGLRRLLDVMRRLRDPAAGCPWDLAQDGRSLARYTLEEAHELVAALEEDYTSAPITEQEKVMLDYVVQITRDATRISPADHERLRAVGFDDKGILQITLIASWFNYINRVADALGVGRGD